MAAPTLFHCRPAEFIRSIRADADSDEKDVILRWDWDLFLIKLPLQSVLWCRCCLHDHAIMVVLVHPMIPLTWSRSRYTLTRHAVKIICSNFNFGKWVAEDQQRHVSVHYEQDISRCLLGLEVSSGKSRERGVPGKLYSAQPFVISESCSFEMFETTSRCTKDIWNATVLHLQVGAWT